MASDFELLDAWRAGDEDAGSELLRQQFDTLFRFFRSKVDAEQVGELIQQTLVTCVERRDELRGEARFSTYAYAVARSVLIAHYRQRNRAQRIDPAVSSVADLTRSPSDVMLERERDRLLLQALRAIPLDHQLLLELHYWEHLRGPELARILEVPEGTIRTRLRRAKQLLREAITTAGATAAMADSTVDNLTRWAQSLRERIDAAAAS